MQVPVPHVERAALAERAAKELLLSLGAIVDVLDAIALVERAKIPEYRNVDVVLRHADGLEDVPPQPDSLAALVDVVDPRLGHLGDDAQMEAFGIGMVLGDPSVAEGVEERHEAGIAAALFGANVGSRHTSESFYFLYLHGVFAAILVPQLLQQTHQIVIVVEGLAGQLLPPQERLARLGPLDDVAAAQRPYRARADRLQQRVELAEAVGSNGCWRHRLSLCGGRRCHRLRLCYCRRRMSLLLLFHRLIHTRQQPSQLFSERLRLSHFPVARLLPLPQLFTKRAYASNAAMRRRRGLLRVHRGRDDHVAHSG